MFQMGLSDLNPTVRGLAQAPPRVLPGSPLPPSRYIRRPQKPENRFLFQSRLSAFLLSSTNWMTQRARVPYWKPPLLLGRLLAYIHPTLALGITHCHLLHQRHLKGLPHQTPQLLVLFDHPKGLVAGVCGKTPKRGTSSKSTPVNP